MTLFKSSKKFAKLKRSVTSLKLRMKTGLLHNSSQNNSKRKYACFSGCGHCRTLIFLCQWFATTAVFIFNYPKFSWWERPDVRLLCSQVLNCLPNSVSCSQPPPCPHRQHVSAHLSSSGISLFSEGRSPFGRKNFEHLRPDYCKCLILLRWHCPSSNPSPVGTGRKEHTHTQRF